MKSDVSEVELKFAADFLKTIGWPESLVTRELGRVDLAPAFALYGQVRLKGPETLLMYIKQKRQSRLGAFAEAHTRAVDVAQREKGTAGPSLNSFNGIPSEPVGETAGTRCPTCDRPPHLCYCGDCRFPR